MSHRFSKPFRLIVLLSAFLLATARAGGTADAPAHQRVGNRVTQTDKSSGSAKDPRVKSPVGEQVGSSTSRSDRQEGERDDRKVKLDGTDQSRDDQDARENEEGDGGRVLVRRRYVPLGHFLRGLGFAGGSRYEDRQGDNAGEVEKLDFGNVLANLGVPGSPGIHVFRLPSIVDAMLAGAMSGSFGTPSVEFGKSADGKRLIAKLHIPSQGNHGVDSSAENSRRQLHIAVIGGGSHMRVKVETLAGRNSMVFEHVVRLPVRVTQEGIETVVNPDGTVSTSLRIIGELSARGREWEGSHSEERVSRVAERESSSEVHGLLGGKASLANFLFGGSAAFDQTSSTGEGGDSVETLPSERDIAMCRKQYPGLENRLHARYCVCKGSPTESGRAICFASLLSSAIKVGRHLGKMDASTDAKHEAMACADNAEGRAACLEAVTSKFMEYAIGPPPGGKEGRTLSEGDQIRAAIESEDDGPSTRSSSSLGILLFVFACMLVVLLCLGVGLLRVARQLVASNMSGTAMSSVLSQRSREKVPGGVPSDKRGPSNKLA